MRKLTNRKHRPHLPFELGPRLEQRSGNQTWTVDLRAWGLSRYMAVRNPADPAWPKRGETTRFRDVAEQWARYYWRWAEQQVHDRQARALERAPSGRTI